MRRYKITVKGKVHGVSYRFSTMAEAQKLGLNGLVRNLSNGDVFIDAEGEEESINKLISWCYVGPPLAKVKEVIATEDDLKGYQTFEIKR